MLNGRVAFITGASSGIGAAVARSLSAEGVKLGLASRRGGDLGLPEAVGLICDVRDLVQVEAAVRFTVDTYGSLNILYNNAAVLHRQDALVTNLEEEVWDQIIAVNLKGVYLGCKYAVPELVKAGGGSIVNTSSLAGLLGVGNVHAYTAAKGGVISLTRAIAMAYAAQKVRCNVICPGAVDTPMMAHVLHGSNPKLRQSFEKGHPIGRLGTPEDIAALALYLASDESSWVTGSVFTIDGGYAAQ